MKKKGRLTKEQLERAKCVDSPTGAHHWRIDEDGLGCCKYCGEERRFHISWPMPGSRYNSMNTNQVPVTTPKSPLTLFGKMRDHRW